MIEEDLRIIEVKLVSFYDLGFVPDLEISEEVSSEISSFNVNNVKFDSLLSVRPTF